MRLLSIGTDRKLFEEGGAVRERQAAYADALGAMDIIVFTKKFHHAKAFAQGPLTVTPTDSYSRHLFGLDTFRIMRGQPQPDVITAQDPFETGLLALLISTIYKLPLHIQVHTDFTSPYFARSSFTNRIRVSIAWFVLKRADRIRVVLQKTADEIIARGIAIPISVLPIYIDTTRFAAIARTKHPKWKIALLCIGRLEREKNFCLAIDALKAAVDAGHDAGLTIVGDGRERETLAQRARDYGISNRVVFAGYQNDLTPFLSSADLVLVPSRFEGYGMVIVEALAAAIPVLATDVGAAREAGAIVVSRAGYSKALVDWIGHGPRQGDLAFEPYRSFDEYVQKWCADIAACATKK